MLEHDRRREGLGCAAPRDSWASRSAQYRAIEAGDSTAITPDVWQRIVEVFSGRLRCASVRRMSGGLRDLLLRLSPSARDELRTVLNRDDLDEITALLLRYGGGWDDDVIDIFTMYPEARRRAMRLLADMDLQT
jgi:hypothetical protein